MNIIKRLFTRTKKEDPSVKIHNLLMNVAAETVLPDNKDWFIENYQNSFKVWYKQETKTYTLASPASSQFDVMSKIFKKTVEQLNGNIISITQSNSGFAPSYAVYCDFTIDN